MGDSYSSGEGDTDTHPVTGDKYYRPWTDIEENYQAGQPREKCHISTQSYPYKLAFDMNLAMDDPKQWDTVACAGATAWDVKNQATENYKGQGKGAEQLWSQDANQERLDGYSVAALKSQALNEYIPGRQKQIEFMKKYHPKAITLTVGGNDVDFVGKVSDCLLPSLVSCKIANQQGRKDLGTELQKQFSNLTSLYQELKDASPSTKIYVLGYTQVINGNNDITNCLGDSIGGLDDSERRVIAEGYSYLNKVIEEATKYVGVKYIDVEAALSGYRLCDGAFGERDATGFTYRSGITQTNERQESFHPNAKGHKAIAAMVKTRLHENNIDYTLLNYPYAQQPNHFIAAPAPTPYLASEPGDTKTVQTKKMTESSAQRGTPLQVVVDAYGLLVGSVANIGLQSDPINLGEHTVNPDGSLNVSVIVPATVPAGYHTLILTGKSYSGEPIQYEQVIFVHGSNLNDIDEDGISDNVDKCLFVTPANADRDSDGIDDACDLEIGEPKEAYRIRGGVVVNGEQANYLYIERNVNAATLTGISGDYDPDHDGWAVVAASQNAAQAGSYAKFWIDGNNGSKVPHVSLRTAENGCVQYKPANLTKVIDGSPRALAQEATDTNTCRSEPVAADLDNNGQPDNTQPLYRARNGITANGEDSRKLYLERSTRAAEAQLGKSDYAVNETPSTGPTDTVDHRKAWSRLATSQPGLIVDTYKKLAFINNQPYVLATNFLNQCYAYKSQSLATIKQSTQATRQLQLDWSQSLILQLQGGCNG